MVGMVTLQSGIHTLSAGDREGVPGMLKTSLVISKRWCCNFPEELRLKQILMSGTWDEWRGTLDPKPQKYVK